MQKKVTSRQAGIFGMWRSLHAHTTSCNITMFRLDPCTFRLQPFRVTVQSQINQIREMRTEVETLIFIPSKSGRDSGESPYLWPQLTKNWGGLQSTRFSMPISVLTKKRNWRRQKSQICFVWFSNSPQITILFFHLFQPMFTPARSKAQSQGFKSFCLNFLIHFGWFC